MSESKCTSPFTLISINAKYEHEGLAVWCLKAACDRQGISTRVMQFSINDSPTKVWASILEQHSDVIAFSCYIWNREIVLKLINDLKKVRPECTIIVGGPEVSYSGSEKDYYACGADFVLKGAGEVSFPRLLKAISSGGGGEGLETQETSETCCESQYVSPFMPEYLSRIKDRIAYIESSRGCPFKCSYCLSSETRKMVYHPLEDIEADLKKLVNAKAKVIKFVDRSFNVNINHALAIWEIIRGFSDEDITFHFEINPDILSTEQIESLSTMRPGLVQIEAGIQSVNTHTLKEVSRVMNVEQAIKNLQALMGKGNLHIHTDLIAGLPYESFESFKESFNKVYQIGAHHMQLGFLKLLRGTRIRDEDSKHGYKYSEYPPYEVLENNYISAQEMLILKAVEEVLDRTWNSGRFTYTLQYLVCLFATPFDLYEGFAKFLKDKERLYQPMAAKSLFMLLREYALDVDKIKVEVLDSLLALDYACSLKNTVIPDFLDAANVKSIDLREFIEQTTPEQTWKKELRKKFLILEGCFPNNTSRVLVDVDYIDRVTQRAIPQYLT